MTKTEIITFAKKQGAFSCGIAPFRVYDELIPRLQSRGWTPFVRQDIRQRIDPFLLLKAGRSVIVCLFLYLKGDDQTIAKYKRGGDYRVASKEKLRIIANELGSHVRTKILVDSGTLCDRHLAYLAGLGYFGRNHMLYAPGIGSRFTIGSILTDLLLEPDVPLDKTCPACGRCSQACPGGALDDTFDVTQCASYFLHTNESLTETQQRIVNECPTTLGCDLCADVCPLNKV